MPATGKSENTAVCCFSEKCLTHGCEDDADMEWIKEVNRLPVSFCPIRYICNLSMLDYLIVQSDIEITLKSLTYVPSSCAAAQALPSSPRQIHTYSPPFQEALPSPPASSTHCQFRAGFAPGMRSLFQYASLLDCWALRHEVKGYQYVENTKRAN